MALTEIIVKYNGDIFSVANAFNSFAEILSPNYAILFYQSLSKLGIIEGKFCPGAGNYWVFPDKQHLTPPQHPSHLRKPVCIRRNASGKSIENHWSC